MSNYFKLRPSRICSALLISVFSLTILILFMLPVIALVKVVLAILLAGALVYYLRRHAWLLLSSSPVAIRIEGANITLLTRAGGVLPCQILANTLVTPVITILNLLPQEKKRIRSVLIFPDSLDAERNRELRVLLKWGA